MLLDFRKNVVGGWWDFNKLHVDLLLNSTIHPTVLHHLECDWDDQMFDIKIIIILYVVTEPLIDALSK